MSVFTVRYSGATIIDDCLPGVNTVEEYMKSHSVDTYKECMGTYKFIAKETTEYEKRTFYKYKCDKCGGTITVCKGVAP